MPHAGRHPMSLDQKPKEKPRPGRGPKRTKYPKNWLVSPKALSRCKNIKNKNKNKEPSKNTNNLNPYKTKTRKMGKKNQGGAQT